MSLTRSLCKSLGLTEEQVTAIIEAHTETTDALKESRDKYKSDLEAIQDAGESWKQKYEKEHSDFESYKDEQTKAIGRDAVKNAYKDLLKEIGVSEKRIDAVMKVSDLSEMELTKEGKIKGVEKLKDSIKEEWSDFIVSSDSSGDHTETPPKNAGGTPMTKDSIMAIKDPRERQKMIAENLELFQR